MVEGMRGIIGESGTQAVIINWKLEDCMDRPHEFHERLYSVLKEPGTGVIERSIVKELYRAIGEHYRASEQVNFEDSIHLARRLFLTKEEF